MRVNFYDAYLNRHDEVFVKTDIYIQGYSNTTEFTTRVSSY